jgi:uncharacterized protein YcgL (UPF0745 family)
MTDKGVVAMADTMRVAEQLTKEGFFLGLASIASSISEVIGSVRTHCKLEMWF